jgi:hypothetical protein
MLNASSALLSLADIPFASPKADPPWYRSRAAETMSFYRGPSERKAHWDFDGSYLHISATADSRTDENSNGQRLVPVVKYLFGF